MITAYSQAQEAYAAFGINTEVALKALAAIPISLHCWQGDDVAGFEKSGATLSGGGIQATGNYPGRARNIVELQTDLDQALTLIPGTHRLNLHAIYGDFRGKNIDRDGIDVSYYQGWIDWAKERKMGMDFNPSCFSHPLASEGFTLSSADKGIRNFWITHCQRSRQIGAEIGKQLKSPCVTNVWIPDGFKDLPIDRKAPRERLEIALDTVFAEKLDLHHNLDAIECKLFGIGTESYVVGSHEFCMGYAVTRQKLLCLDSGHFHPTENIADKISAILQFVPKLLLHASRGVRWDSDHVPLFDDPTRALMEEIVRGNFLSRTHIGLDFFDASINRVAAWVIGTRNVLKCLLVALLEPIDELRKLEVKGDFTSRLALLEESKTLYFAPVWDEYCTRQNTVIDRQWLKTLKKYEGRIVAKR